MKSSVLLGTGQLVLLAVLCSLQISSQSASGNGQLWNFTSNCSEILSGLGIPADIAVPSGQKLQAAYYAEGLQHYSFNGTDWVVFNATADLYPLEAFKSNVGSSRSNGYGRKQLGGGHMRSASANLKKDQVVGQHFFLGQPDAAGGQPSWETYLPSSSLVTARSLQAITVDPNSITWNLLQATAHTGSKDLLGAVTYVQRVATKGGLPPSTTTNAQFGDVHLTPYSIVYVFYNKAQ